jgi:hypothetical protein
MTTIGMLAAAVVNLAACVCPQQNSAPNPYRTIENWAKLPEGRMWGSTSVSPHAKTERMARELKNFQNVILPGKNHMSAIAVGGPMPPQYTTSLIRTM